jgi:N utilization substance protein A
MFDLKTINLVLDQLEEERGVPRAKMLEAIESALATAYKKEYGKKGQIVRAHFDIGTGAVDFFQVKIVVDPEAVLMDDEEPEEPAEGAEEKVRFNPESHIFLADARMMKKDVAVGEELVFPLEQKSDFGRIAAQTAKQVIIQKIREAEKASVVEEYGAKEGEIVGGTVQRIERGSIFVDLGRATGIIPYDEQIPGERYRPGERIRGYLFSVDEGSRGIYLRLSRSHPKFLEKLFELEAPELANGAIIVKAIAREPGQRSKIAVYAQDEHIDPVGAMVGGRGVRVSTVMSELGGEKIDIIEWSPDEARFIEDALSPAKVLSVSLDSETRTASVEVTEDQQSLAIGRGGQNVRLAAKLTGWRIDIRSLGGTKEETIESDEKVEMAVDTEQKETGEAKETATDAGEKPEGSEEEKS